MLENLLGAPPPQPPPGVETNLEKDAEQVKVTSLRQRLEQHRANAACAACHKLMDPIGLTLENFDHTGKWRTVDGTTPIDASASDRRHRLDRPGVAAPRAAGALRRLRHRVRREDADLRLGRAMRPQDLPAVRAIVRAPREDGYRFSSLVQGVVAAPQFQMRTKSSGAPEPQ